MEKINIAELLKTCPKGMELDCTCADNVVFDKIIEYEQIKCVIGECCDPLILDKYGRLRNICCPKCVIFPKGKTTWEGFRRPFKDGDITVDTLGGIHIMQNSTTSYCYFDRLGILDMTKTTCVRVERLATEEEKQKLFDAIKASGYKWNAETKTLEKLVIPKFKVGDWIVQKVLGIYKIVEVCESWYEVISYNNGIQYSIGFDKENDCRLWTIQDAKAGDVLANDKHILIFKELGYTALSNGKPENLYAYCGIKPDGSFELGKEHYCFCGILHTHPATKEQRNTLFAKMKEAGYKWDEEKKELKKIEPKFKVGDRIRSIISSSCYTILDIKNDQYFIKSDIEKYPYQLPFSNEINYELVPNKFDISKLKPFDKVLTRANNDDSWVCNFYSHRIKDYYVVLNAELAPQCIPYEGNEHLLSTTNDCNEFYKTWK